MTRLEGKLLNVEDRSGVSKDGKPYTTLSLLVLDKDNDVSMIRVFDRDVNKIKAQAKSLKIGENVKLKIDKIERLSNRTLDGFGVLDS